MTLLCQLRRCTSTGARNAVVDASDDCDQDYCSEDHQMDVAYSQDAHERNIEPLFGVNLFVAEQVVDFTSFGISCSDFGLILLAGIIKRVHRQVEIEVIAVNEPANLG
eukprot:CAMPEP_0170457732 /NCGR_PEP_ID=MMETSP0123-20130129/4923_1 /TAXON_ID=182087 /ORGANISM="Favella ehrenbergii, Strain Fehren 1" /LENGTH=107 /DNA_ID=CAMNT_0010721617 /DNA_START=715 /DNA_END=1038 /DNA_ORIENTATION=+